MRKVRAEDDCCAHRDSMAKKKEAARSRKNSRNVTSGGGGGCCAGKRLTCAEISKVQEEPSVPCGKIVKKRPKRIVKKQESCSIDFRILARIKPTLSERERYSNIYHLMCILEADELVRLREIQKVREKLEESDELDGSEIQTDKQTLETDQNVKEIASSTKSLKSVTSNDEDTEKKSLTVGGKTSDQTAENRNDKKVKIATGKCALENKSECGSICSFDSEVDLTGLHLTKDDVEKIEKNREQIREQQKAKKDEAAEE